MAKQILIVDDEPGIRQLLSHMLTAQGYDLIQAGSATEALEVLSTHPCQLALVDLLLPDVNGLELAEAIRMLDPGTPVILMTAYGTPAFESMAAHPAITHYVHKPFDLDRLLALVKRILPQQP